MVGRRAGDGRDAVDKLGPEQNVGIGKHALLERDNDELRVGEVRLDHAPDVLCMAQVQRCVHLCTACRHMRAFSRMLD